MALLNWLIAVVATITLAVILGLTFVPSSADRTVGRLARNVGLTIEPSVESHIRRSVLRRQRLTTLGALIALWVAVPLLAIVPTSLDDFSQSWLLIGAEFLGVAAGSTASAIGSRDRVAETGLRVARARAVVVADYLAPSTRTSARFATSAAVVVLCGAFAALAIAGFSHAGVAMFVAAAGLTGLAGISLAVLELVGPRIVARAQPAGSPAELAWDDALRSVTLRDLATAPIAVGLYALSLGIGVLANTLPIPPAAAAIAAGLVICLVAGVVLGVVLAASQKPQRHYLRRLWPELAETGH